MVEIRKIIDRQIDKPKYTKYNIENKECATRKQPWGDFKLKNFETKT